VVGSDVPGLRDAIRDGATGLLYEYGNVEDLSGKIVRLLEDGAARRKLAEEAYQWSLTFDWGRVAELTVGILEKEIRGRSR
jgi:glycosyltransferase involved in cell wall biosynthesis